MRRSGASPTGLHDSPAARLLLIALPTLLVIAPLPYGGRTPAGSSALCAGATVIAVCALLASRGVRSQPSPLDRIPAAFPLCGLLLIAALQMVPFPQGVLSMLSPAALAFRVRAVLGGPVGAVPLSLHPSASLATIGRIAASLAVFAAAAVVARRQVGTRRIATGLFGAGLVQAIYGLVDFLSGHQRAFSHTHEQYLGRISGTFTNPDHFAGLLELAIPATIGLMITVESPSSRAPAIRRRGLRGRLAELVSDPAGGRRRALALCLGLMVTSLLFSRSRSGIALAGAASLAVILFGGRQSESTRASNPAVQGIPKRVAAGRLGLVVGSVAIVLVSIAPIARDQLQRLAGTYSTAPTEFLAKGGRLAVWGDVTRMIADHPLTGIGLGAFTATFPRYRGPDVTLRWEEAHNDFLQLAAETGITGSMLALLVMISAAIALRRSLSRGGEPDPLRPLRAALACGCGALLLHEILDFNLQIPSNAIAFAAAAAGSIVRPLPELPRRLETGVTGRLTLQPAAAFSTLLIALAGAGALWGVFLPEDPSVDAIARASSSMVRADEMFANPATRSASGGPGPGQVLEEARTMLETALDGNPGSADAHLLLARLDRRAGLLALGDPVPAGQLEDQLAFAASLDPYRPDLRLGILREHVALGDADGALDDLAALAVRGGDVVVTALPLAWSIAGDTDTISDVINEAAPRGRGQGEGAGSSDARFILAEFLLRLGREEDAERQLRSLLGEGPILAVPAYGRLVTMLRARGAAGEAVRMGEALLAGGEMGPSEGASLRISLARSLVAAGDAQRSIPLAQQALALLPGQPGVHLAAADAYLAAGQAGEAARQFEFLLRGGAPAEFVALQEKQIRYGLARSYDLLHRRDEALREWREVVRIDPDDGKARERVRVLTHGF